MTMKTQNILNKTLTQTQLKHNTQTTPQHIQQQKQMKQKRNKTNNIK